MAKNSRIGTRLEQVNDRINLQVDILQEQAEQALLNLRVPAPKHTPIKGPVGNLVIHNLKKPKKDKKEKKED